MPPKKQQPPPQSDESDYSDSESVAVKKVAKKSTKEVKRVKKDNLNPDERLEQAAGAVFDNSDQEDDDRDLFALELPSPPDFLTKPNNTDRLMILNVEVENFKSYFGKASIGPFHKSFTSIIGPNGSGKSNLIDALLFVFGFRASKIRSAKVANLLHKSRGREPDFCTVTIVFQRIRDLPNLHYQVVEDSKFTISRTGYKNSSSSYAIDGKPASVAQVQARLKKVDIDIEHNRFLILQGEVEQIAMMKPVKTTKSETGMVEYLEDIIGSNRLEPFVKLFQKRVDRLTCDHSQQKIARDHARLSKMSMEPSVRTALEFLSKENELTEIRMKLDQRLKLKYTDKAAPLTKKIEEKQEERQKLAERLDSNKGEYSEMDELEKKMNKERNSLDREIDKVTRELTDLTQEDSRRKETIKRYEADIRKTEIEKEKEIKKRKNLETVPEKAEKKIEKWTEEVQLLAEVKKTADEKADENLDEFAKRTEKPKAEQAKIQEQWAEINAHFNKARGEATVARAELEDMKKRANSGTKKLDELKTRLTSSEEKLEDAQQNLASIADEHKRNEEVVKRLNAEEPAFSSATRNKQQEAFVTGQRLEAKRSALNSSASSNELMRRLMEEKKKGAWPSLLGRLGDLGYVDPKYDVLISTNFNLNKIICEKQDDAAAILQFVKQNKMPRVDTYSLDRMTKFPDELLAPAPRGKYPTPRVYDLIECEENVKPFFYFFFQESIVADSIQHAQQMYRNKVPANICTLCGSMLARNGNFTGGGGKRRGGIITDRSKQAKQVTDGDKMEVRQLEERFEKLKVEAEEMRIKQDEMSRELFQARAKNAEMAPRVAEYKRTIQSETEAVARLKKLIVEQEKEASKVEVDQSEIDEKEAVVVELEKKRDELSEKTEAVKNRQAEIQSKLDELFRELVQCHRDEAKQSAEKIAKLEKDMAKENANSQNSERNIAKCDENLARFEKEIEKKLKMCEELKEQQHDEEMVEEKKKAVEEKEAKRKEMETAFEELTKKRSALSKAETELEEQLKKANEEVVELKEKKQAHSCKIDEIQKKLDKLQLNRIPIFQFMSTSNRVEDFDLQFDDELNIPDENQRPEDFEKAKKHIACVMGDRAYALEFRMRQKVLDNTEAYENVDGPKMVPVDLLSEDQVRAITDRDKEQLEFKEKQCQQQIEALKQKVDVSVIETYIQKVKQFNEETIKVAVITENLRKHNKRLYEIKKMRLDEFHNAFEFIGKHLVAVYKMLTDGGDAKLEYIDKDDPFTQGISFMVRPAKKAWKQIQYLSGGEKTLSSLALIFALHMFRPTPFYVMDEIDAALDYRNVSIIAQYVRQKTENAQFIIISLRNNMFELANRLVGIYKVDGCTQNVAIDPLAVCQTAKLISDSLGQATCTLPEEVSQRYNETMSRQNKELTAQEKQYPNFPSSSEISKAEKIVSVEGRVRKQFNNTTVGGAGGATNGIASRPQSKATDRAASSRPESRQQIKIPVPRLVERASSGAAQQVSEASSSSEVVAASPKTRTPRRARRNVEEDDEITPPAKRANSSASSAGSPRKSHGSAQKNGRVSRNLSKNSKNANEDDDGEDSD